MPAAKKQSGPLAKKTLFVQILQAAGAELVEIELPGLNEVRVSHMISIVSEMVTSQMDTDRRYFATDTRFSLALASRWGYGLFLGELLRASAMMLRPHPAA